MKDYQLLKMSSYIFKYPSGIELTLEKLTEKEITLTFNGNDDQGETVIPLPEEIIDEVISKIQELRLARITLELK